MWTFDINLYSIYFLEIKEEKLFTINYGSFATLISNIV